METNNRLPHPARLDVPVVKLRYFAYNCYEIKLPGGKTLVIDPCLETEGDYVCGYTEEALESCDYVYINHTHSDHIATLGKVYNRFEPMILAHAGVCWDLAEFFDIPYCQFFPYECGQSYDFGDFKIQILPGIHNKIGKMRPSGRLDGSDTPYVVKGLKTSFSSETERRLQQMGTLFNYNFLLTLPNNFRIGFIAGAPGMCTLDERIWRDLRPDVVMVQRSRWGYPGWTEQMAHTLEVTGARLLLPLHMEDSCAGTYDPEEYVRQVNLLCEQKGLFGRMMFPQRAKWYELSTGISLI